MGIIKNKQKTATPMFNKTLLITTILAALLIVQPITAATAIPTSTFLGIDPVAASEVLNKLISQFTAARSALNTRRFLTRLDEQQKVDIKPLTDAFDMVKQGIDEFSKQFPNFFKEDQLKESLKHISDNSDDFFIIDSDLTTNTLNSLGHGLQS